LGFHSWYTNGRFNCRQINCLRTTPNLARLLASDSPALADEQGAPVAPKHLPNTNLWCLWRVDSGAKWQCNYGRSSPSSGFHVLHHQNFLSILSTARASRPLTGRVDRPLILVDSPIRANDHLYYDCRLLRWGADTYDTMADFDLSFIPALYTPSALLPIARHKKSLLYTIETHPVTILIGQTGSGKTTQLPQFLHQAGWTSGGKCIAVTQVGRLTWNFGSDCI